MRLIIIFLILILSVNVNAQTADDRTKSSDSLRSILKTKLNTDFTTVDKVMGYIEQSAIDISTIMKDTILSKEQKGVRMKQAAAERDQKIATILSPVQIAQLKEELKSMKYRMKSIRLGASPNSENH
ncbi:hypothetical protein [Pseudoflavitalea rhizosphaerae]|uniref:hypothetical protein n=1 Tax=Pseudoflavitalea rhizosphaerae TaxID=1884793 RepID=UPI000F8E75C3|nr:hypothetical protein [Pseudoflavitalea rhizosphaerae]